MAAPTRRVAVLAGRYPDDRYSVNRGYIDAILALGATPLIVPSGPGADPAQMIELLELVHAVVLTGGGDVQPEAYGGADHPKIMELDTDRDAVELAFTTAAIERGVRILGICRGIQLLTVALGGTLVPDLPEAGFIGHWQEDKQYEPVHQVEPEAGSVAGLALAGTTLVNSIHHQAVATTGTHLRATAYSHDGVIEAVEADGLLGVQWHPERLLGHDAIHLAPFRWALTGHPGLVQAA